LDVNQAAAPAKRLSFQFADLEQQRQSATLGMWVFLVTEILFFGGLFAGYMVYRGLYPQAWAEASRALLFKYGTINTGVLICSSLTMALAVHAAQVGRHKRIALFLLLTIALGTVFLGIKAVEYTDEYHEHHIPQLDFRFEGADPVHSQIFFGFYFVMTGIHALHLTIGLAIAAVLAWLAWKGHYTPEYYNPIENFGLYWHFIDVIWIFLYPLLYLVAHRGYAG